ncbi:hypothetical protein M6B38_240265 [Iris pallida]|uniref:Uncharacterized protein n=1 Tax=Iris pallida TaxID=29817 RepID=A0AAX6DKE3_IRIPA|nr:hypothetical protein M6B38_240265 [Iris pallida]
MVTTLLLGVELKGGARPLQRWSLRRSVVSNRPWPAATTRRHCGGATSLGRRRRQFLLSPDNNGHQRRYRRFPSRRHRGSLYMSKFFQPRDLTLDRSSLV